jgi:hypothetical protein
MYMLIPWSLPMTSWTLTAIWISTNSPWVDATWSYSAF